MKGPWRHLEYTVFVFCAVSIHWPVKELYFLPKSSLHPRLASLLLSRLRNSQYTHTHEEPSLPPSSWRTALLCSVGVFSVVDIINSWCARLSGTPVLSSHGQSGHGHMAVQQGICAILVPSSAMQIPFWTSSFCSNKAINLLDSPVYIRMGLPSGAFSEVSQLYRPLSQTHLGMCFVNLLGISRPLLLIPTVFFFSIKEASSVLEKYRQYKND